MTDVFFNKQEAIASRVDRSLRCEQPASKVGNNWIARTSIRLNPVYDYAKVYLQTISGYGKRTNYAVAFNDPNNSLVEGEDTVSWQDFDPVGYTQFDFGRTQTIAYNASNIAYNIFATDTLVDKIDLEIELFKIEGLPLELIFMVQVPVVSSDVYFSINYQEIIP